MSYDLSFLRRSPDETWEEALAAPVEGEIRPELLAAWERIVEGAREIFGVVESYAGTQCLELYHESSGMQLTCFPGELSLSAPMPVDFRFMRALVTLVCRETGFDAYDPQVDGPFTS